MTSNSEEQDAISRAGSPSSWSIHPCDPNNWSNDEDEYDKLKDDTSNLLAPCRHGLHTGGNGQRPVSDGEGPTGDTDTGKFILDGRPDGFRPGTGVVSKSTTSDPDLSGAATNLGAPVGVIVGALTALVAATIFLVARKRSRKDSDQATLIRKGEGADASSDGDDVNTTAIDSSFEGDIDGAAARPIDVDDADAILADIESFGGLRLASSAMVGAMMATTVAASAIDDNDVSSTKNDRSINNNVELDPEAAAAYLAGGSVAAAAVIAKRRASNAAAADVEAQEEAADDTVEESFLSAEEDADVTRDESFLSANSKDLGRRHTVLHVPECQSVFCTGCQYRTTFQEVSFVPAAKVNHQADDMALAGGAKAWLAEKVAAEEGKTNRRVRWDCA